mgnify:CR=1 FL=1
MICRNALYVEKQFNGHMQLFQRIAVLEKKAGVLSRRGRRQFDHMTRKLLLTDRELAERVIDGLSDSVDFGHGSIENS